MDLAFDLTTISKTYFDFGYAIRNKKSRTMIVMITMIIYDGSNLQINFKTSLLQLHTLDIQPL